MLNEFLGYIFMKYLFVILIICISFSYLLIFKSDIKCRSYDSLCSVFKCIVIFGQIKLPIY